MTQADPAEITRLLLRCRDDQGSALRDLLPLVYGDLRRIAGAQMRRERPDHTLEPTALVNEAFLRLVDQREVDWKDRARFLAAGAQAMRRVLLNHARAKRADKRGGGATHVSVHEDLVGKSRDRVDVLDLHEKLEELHALQPRPARVVELRFFGGLNFDEAGHVLGISPRTVEADWYFARTWLRRALKAAHQDRGTSQG